MEIFENQPTDQFAMRIPVSGTLDNAQQNIWAGFVSIFSNAFGSAFTKDTDGTIDIRNVIKKYRETPDGQATTSQSQKAEEDTPNSLGQEPANENSSSNYDFNVNE